MIDLLETSDTSTIVEYSDGTIKVLGSKPATRDELVDHIDTLIKHIDCWHEDGLYGVL